MAPEQSDGNEGALRRLIAELRRRRVFRTAMLYVVGAWLALQIADVAFPGFGIPEAAIGALIWAAVLGLPIAILFGWFFDIGAGGIRRTHSLDSDDASRSRPLRRSDYAVLATFVIVTAGWAYDTTRRVRTASLGASAPTTSEAASVAVARPKLDNSVAVLPFANISSDKDNDYFCDGISEEILNELSRFAKLNVIGRTSSFTFKNSDVGTAAISDALGVHFVLQGSVRKYGDQLRIAAQLLDEHGVQVWAKTFDRELRNVLDIQSEIASAVATMVASEISTARRAAHVPPVEAYERFLAGRELLHHRDNGAAERELLRAIEIDPEFAEAYAELGISESMGVWQLSRLTRAREHIDRAIELQPELLRARAGLGLWLQTNNTPDWAESERVLRDVVVQEPNMVDALLWLSSALAQLGRIDESLSLLERANKLDPLHPSIAINLASNLLDRGEQERAFAAVARVLEEPTTSYAAYSGIRELLRNTARLVEQNEYAKRQLVQLRGPHYWSMALSYGLIQDWERMHYWLERSRRERPEVMQSHFARVNLPTMQGRFDLAISVFQETVAEFPGSRELGRDFSAWLATLHAKAGDYAAAIGVLEPLIAKEAPGNPTDVPSLEAMHGLAWAYRRTGREKEAAALLTEERRSCLERKQARALNASDSLYACAENALLSGDSKDALDLLEQAVASGFCELYILETDPYWMPLHDDGRYMKLTDRVRETVEKARAEIRRRDAAEDFVAKYDAIVAQHAGDASR